jgi:hypothetical protein
MTTTTPRFLWALAANSLHPPDHSWFTALIVAAILLTLPAQGRSQFQSLATSVFETDPGSFLACLNSHNRPVTAELKAAAVVSFEASLPDGGEIKNLNPAERRKLAVLPRVLQIHQRDSVYEIRVLALPQAAVGFYARAVLWISRPALDLLSAEQLQGAVAHELGHDYLWAETRAAQESKNYRQLREIELFCDAVGMMTLKSAGLSASHMLAGVKKLADFNQPRFGTALNAKSYPSLAERRKLARQVIRWAAGVY